MADKLDQEALDYHRFPPPGKVALVVTKPPANQHDLSLAYSPGVAAASELIHDDPSEAFNLTSRGNFVAMIHEGRTAEINDYNVRYTQRTGARIRDDVISDADVFLRVSAPGGPASGYGQENGGPATHFSIGQPNSRNRARRSSCGSPRCHSSDWPDGLPEPSK